jgi:hypothetical protein
MASSLLSAQKIPGKFGKPPKEHLNASVCPIDSSAGAYVVYDYGEVRFDYNEHNGFYWTLDRHLVIKILNKSEYDQATFSIPLNRNIHGREEVNGLKAATHIVKDGKTISTKMNRRDAIEEEKTDELSYYKFTLPNVEEGCLIEVNYSLMSEFAYYLRDWYFQWNIPVLHSEVYVSIPEYLTYHQNMKGFHSLTKNENTVGNGRITFTVQNREGYSVGGRTGGKSIQSVDHRVFNKHFVANNIPALKEEAFVDNMKNYRSGVEFELESVRIGTNYTEYTKDWNAEVYNLLGASYFGDRLDKAGFASDEVKEIIASYPDQLERLHAVYEFVKNRMKWNGELGFTNEISLRKVYKNGNGTAADINFILINLLREAGIDAYPVALSTRDNGIIFPTYPTMDGFNNAVALALIGEKQVLMDASDPYCPPGTLPTRCINGKGRIIDQKLNSWIDLNPNSKYEESTMYTLELDETGVMRGHMNFKEEGYASVSMRNRLEKAVNEEKFIEDLENKHPGLDILSYEIKGKDEAYGPLKGVYEIEITDRTEFMGDLISFNPFLFEQTEENPFKLEERKIPVNFTYPRSIKYMFQYKIPEDFVVEAIPENINLMFPDKSVKFLYSATQIGNAINIAAVLDVDRHIYTPSEYKNLKEFFNQLVAKEAEMILIKKNKSTP